MGEPPAISVIMATYNEEDFIEEAVQSISNQTFSDLELVIVDDASTDKTPELIENIPDERVKQYKVTERIPPSSCRNLAVKKSKGEYIAVMDADDVSLENRLELEKEFLDKNPEYGIVGGLQVLVDESLNPLRFMRFPESNGGIRRQFLFKNPFSHGSVMFRRELFDRVGGYRRLDRYNCEDLDLLIRICSETKARNLQVPLYLYRRHSGQRTGFLSVSDRLRKRILPKLTALRRLNYNLDEISEAVLERTDQKHLKRFLFSLI